MDDVYLSQCRNEGRYDGKRHQRHGRKFSDNNAERSDLQGQMSAAVRGFAYKDTQKFVAARKVIKTDLLSQD